MLAKSGWPAIRRGAATSDEVKDLRRWRVDQTGPWEVGAAWHLMPSALRVATQSVRERPGWPD